MPLPLHRGDAFEIHCGRPCQNTRHPEVICYVQRVLGCARALVQCWRCKRWQSGCAKARLGEHGGLVGGEDSRDEIREKKNEKMKIPARPREPPLGDVQEN